LDQEKTSRGLKSVDVPAVAPRLKCPNHQVQRYGSTADAIKAVHDHVVVINAARVKHALGERDLKDGYTSIVSLKKPFLQKV
jgi:hypothetical protein